MKVDIDGLTPQEAYAVGHQRGMTFVLEAITEFHTDDTDLEWEDVEMIMQELIRNMGRHPALMAALAPPAERKQNVHCTCDRGMGVLRHNIWCPVHGRATP